MFTKNRHSQYTNLYGSKAFLVGQRLYVRLGLQHLMTVNMGLEHYLKAVETSFLVQRVPIYRRKVAYK